MNSMTIDHQQGTQFVARARGHELVIDLPTTYKGGRDMGLTPPELFIASLGSCIGVYVINYLAAQEVLKDGVRVEVSWEDANSPARISSISARVHLPDGISEEHRRMALKAAEQCKIHNTICNQPDISITVE